ncbi:unnamed protein product [Linum tenue]|uniref:Uncharacterized protein n=1 Tax=Linum tenue TaxID=586396 RepID=A0AAV0J8Q1_9ROSI|nr:unnamed protein product [Linum tenue]
MQESNINSLPVSRFRLPFSARPLSPKELGETETTKEKAKFKNRKFQFPRSHPRLFPVSDPPTH